MTTDPHGITPASDIHGTHPAAGHGHDHPVHAPFNETEIQEFHRSDIGAGTVVILLMTSIFLAGVCLYAVVAVVTY